MHVQRMFEMSRALYTGRNFKRNSWKIKGNFGTLYTFLTISANLFYFIKMYNSNTASMAYAFTLREYWLIEKRETFQNGAFCDFFYFTLNCVTTRTRNMPIVYKFGFIYRKKIMKTLRRAKVLTC